MNIKKKLISLSLASAMSLSFASALAEESLTPVTVTLDGQVVTRNAYLKGWTTYAHPEDLFGPEIGNSIMFTTDKIAVRDYYEKEGKDVYWNQTTKTVSVRTPSEDVSNRYYRLVNKATGNVIAAENHGQDNLSLIVTEPKNEADKNQIYRLAKIDDQYGHLMNMLSRRSLDVPDAKTEEDVQLIQYTYYSNIQQKMEFFKDEEGYYTISPAHCLLFLTEKDGKVVQAADQNSDFAKWKLEFVMDSVLDSVEKSEGYSLLSDNRQGAVSRYFSSDLWISGQAKNNAEASLAAADYSSLSGREQANLLEDAANFTASFQVGGTYPSDHVAKYKILSKTADPEYDIWRGSKCPCWIYEVEMEGDAEGQIHKFTFVSNEEDVPMVTKSIEALGRTPYAIRQYVHKLYWKAGDGANSFNGGGNEIWIRLNYEPATSMQIASTLFHELGHILDSNTLPNNDVWSYAESLDACPISGYGASNQAEDLAEFNKLYFMSRGTDTFDDLQKTYPNRFAVLSGMLYRADSKFFADLAPYEAKITEIENILAHRADNSIASSIDDTKYYYLIDKATGKAATVTDAKTDNETPLILADNEGLDNQIFSIEKYGDTVRFFVKHSGSSIQLDDSGMSNKTINQYGGTWAVDDRWSVYEKDGGYIFNSVRYDLSLSNDGTNVVQNKNATVWELVPAGENASKKDMYITSSQGASLIAAPKAEGDKFSYLTASSDKKESWKLKNLNDDVYMIIRSEDGKAIDILDLSKEPGARAILWDQTGADNQLFVKEDVDGKCMFRSVLSDLYLTVGHDNITQESKGEPGSEDYERQLFTITDAE